jgi:dTDP-4-dehydrorhamnose reductase
MIKVGIIGSSGFIGKRLYYYMQNYKADFQIYGTYCRNPFSDEAIRLDVTNREELKTFLLSKDLDIIVWLAALKDVKKCEQDYNLAYRINTQPIVDVIDLKIKHNLKTKIIYMSSDYVFDGERGGYKDTDLPLPKTNYGKTKLMCEKSLMDFDQDYLIIRSSAAMGKGGVFFDWLIKSLQQEIELEVYSNIYFTPTPVKMLCEGIFYLIKNYKDRKIYHICGPKRMSRYEFAKFIKELMPETSCKIKPVELESTNIFQKDLSIIQSDVCKFFITKTFEGYIIEEIK